MQATRRIEADRTVAGARRWMHQQLFNSVGNGVLTVVTVVVLSYLVYSLLEFVLFSADWEVVDANRRLLFLGRYPADQEWRLWPAIWGLFTLAGLSTGLWIGVGRRGLVVSIGVLVFTATVLAEPDANGLRLAVAALLATAGYVFARRALRDSQATKWLQRIVIAGWVLQLPFTVLLLTSGSDGVDTSLWGGFMLNIMLASVGISGGFALGIVLALGRWSSYPVIRWTCATYIETIRAGPLIAWLFMARFVLPDFLPPIAGLDELDIVVRAMLVLAGFTAAYIAEVVRGGLQSLPTGQTEAAKALGMNSLQTTWLIVLPQALRAVIPAIVSQLISLWKDTTLVFGLGLIELLGAGRATSAQPAFIGQQAEALLFVALLFWAVAFTMSRLSMRIERRLGLGER